MNTYILLAADDEKIIEIYKCIGNTFKEAVKNKLLTHGDEYFGIDYIDYIEDSISNNKILSDKDVKLYDEFIKSNSNSSYELDDDQFKNFVDYIINYFKTDMSYAFKLLKIKQEVKIEEIDLNEKEYYGNIGKGGPFPYID